ncbi:polysaccharide deacetylase family protein [Thermococcus thioreducens]|uniref:Peptidoglycan/xylan/chitin deacetylase, PgdA/CDA1 family n=1 Tax=Thermococcus thioreducens TaxID=277988 RepID=A0A0Q2XKD9_9EURY|nr:polysaccharide deacetylase family protein [Thermococcus thioreducens]ASJ12156.1 polysaccharide deacetylase [Thermococcus thioreducens]KQH81556.1 polysaccharide deacetylase [Thermococcus thioreducens]SEV95882.1 Peptidoglycan/xylan/chitin deacetylase, PgdA/CDA1 family [Thermococcus thioreducens]
MIVSITFDVEHDCPPYLTTTKGMEKGLPKLLDLMAEKGVKATFFFTAEMARRFPGLVRRVIDEGHELGSHNYNHERLDKLTKSEGEKAIKKSLKVLRKFGDVVSFRAPNLQFPNYYYDILAKNGILVDSSKAVYKGYREGVRFFGEILEVPASTTSSVIRLPWGIQRIIHSRLREPRVYFAHPWEFVPMQKERIRWDCRFNTGDRALELLGRLIDHYRREGAEFLTMREYYERYQKLKRK